MRTNAPEEALGSHQGGGDKYRLLLDSAAEAIVGIDLQGTCTFCNPAALRILGYHSADGLTGKNVHELMHHTRPDGTHYPWEECHMFAAIREGTSSHVLDEILWRADGTYFSAEYWSYPMYRSSERIGAVITFLDISARREAEQALRLSEARYRGFFENATYGIFLSRPDGSWIDVNPALIEMLGYRSREELLSRSLERDVYEDPAARKSILDRYSTSERVDGAEAAWKRKDGTVIRVRLSGGIVRNPDGTISHFQVIADDITERHSLEDRYRQAQKMQAVGQIAGGVAHDFNNMLGVILGNLELLVERLPPDELSQKYVQQVTRAINSATDVTRQLLAFSRKQILQPVVMNLNRSVEQLNRMIVRLIGENIRVTLALDHSIGLVKADPGQIEQALMNLIVNARDAMPSGGDLKIQTANVYLDQEFANAHVGSKPGAYVSLSVSDTGCGMTPEIQARIFEPFFTTKEVGKGSGLGLATVYGIVKQSNGYVGVRTEAGAGTEFTIYLPVVQQKEDACSGQESKRTSRFAWGAETILLVEDDDSLRETILIGLERLGYRVVEAKSPEQAIEEFKLHGTHIDLLLTDVMMPGMNGRALAEELRKKNHDLRVLYMSGYTDDEILRQGILRSENAILVKPFGQQELGNRIRQTLDKSPRTNEPR